MFLEIPFEEWQPSLHRLFAKNRLLLTACNERKRNTMTIGWGCFGVMWGEAVAMFAVRPSRYTHELLRRGTAVSLSELPPSYARSIAFCGAHSGREGDKLPAAGLTYAELPDGGIGIGEAGLVITGEVCYSHPMLPGELYDRALHEKWYRDGDFHTLYYATISKIYKSC